jgi:arylformamidase
MEITTVLAGASLLIHRAVTRNQFLIRINHQYSPSQWSNRLAADGSKQFSTPDDVVYGNVKGNHVSTVGEGSSIVQKRHSETSKLHVKHEASISDESTIDIYYQQNSEVTQSEQSGDIIVYIHGGYWQALDKKSSCWHADTFLERGNCSAFVAVGYDLCPAVSFRTLVQQIKSAVAHVLGIFPNHRIHIIGHSAGGHLGAEILVTDWEKEFGLDKKPKGYCLVSGVYDLQPIYSSYVNDACQMSKSDAIEFSPSLRPIEHFKKVIKDNDSIRIVIAVGEHDSPAFRQQSRDFYKLLNEHTSAVVTFVEMSGEDHFTSIERLIEDDYVLSESIRLNLLCGV